MAYLGLRGKGIGTRTGPRGGFRGSEKHMRSDNNFFAVLHDPVPDKNGDDHEAFNSESNDGFTIVRGNRQRISTGGESNELIGLMDEPPNYDSLTKDEKLSLILSKVSLNEGRVEQIQNKLDTVLDLKQRVTTVERVILSNTDRLKLLEYRSIVLEASSRRKNILFKGVPESRQENCFAEVREVIQPHLNIGRDMYLERAHRLGRFDRTKTRPIFVAFRDFCDVEDIIASASNLRGSNLRICRDYPKELSLAQQPLWGKFRELREANRNKKVAVEYPARLTVDNVVVEDMFPDRFSVLRGSRVDLMNMPLLKNMNQQPSNQGASANVITDRPGNSGPIDSAINHVPQPAVCPSGPKDWQPSPSAMDYEENFQPRSPSILHGHMPPPPPQTQIPPMLQDLQMLYHLLRSIASENVGTTVLNSDLTLSRGCSATRKDNANKMTVRSKSVRSRKLSVKSQKSSERQTPGPNTGSGARSESRSRSVSQRRNTSVLGNVSAPDPTGLENQLKSQDDNGDEH